MAMENNSSEYPPLRASAFAPQLNNRFVAGALAIDASAVHFRSEPASIALPLDGLQIRRGGHNDEQIFFEHADFPGWSIFSSDDNLPRHPVLLSHPEFARTLRSVDRSRVATPLIVKLGLAAAAAFVLALLLLFMARDRIVEAIVNKIPLSWEQSLGAQVFQQIQAEGKLVENSEWEPRVNDITSRLLPIVEETGYDFQFHIQQDTNINAFAIPGGHVVILTGLLESAQSAEEVAGVLAHEIAHVTRRHSVRNIVKSAGLLVLVQALFGDSSAAIGALAEGSAMLLQQRFSRDFERGADDTGWVYLIEANIDPRGMTRFFETLKESIEQSSGAAAESTLSLLSTHPTTSERIERLEQKWETLNKKTGFVEFDDWPD